MTTQAPHIIRAAVALVAELPEHMIRIVSPDLGGGFGNKVPVYPGYVDVDPRLDPARATGEVDRGPDRQPDLDRLRARHLPRRRAGAAQGRQDPRRPDAHRLRPRRVLLRRPAEQVQDRADALGVRLLRHPGRAPDRPRASTPTRRPAASPTAARSGSPRRCSSRSGWSRRPPTTWAWTRPSSAGVNFVRDDDFPHRTPFGFLTDSGQYGKCLAGRPRRDRVRRTSCAQQEEAQHERPAARHRHLDDDRAARRRQQPRVRHPRHQDVRLRRAAGAHDRQGASCAPGPSRRARATRRPGRRSSPTSSGIPAEDIVVEEGDTDTAPFGMGTYASRSTPVAGAAVAMVSRKVRAKARKLAAHLLEVSEEDVEWELGRFYVRSAPGPGRHHPGVRDGGVQQHARRHGARPGEQRLLRPAQPHLAVRLLHRDRRGRPARPGSGTCCAWSRSTTAASGSTR